MVATRRGTRVEPEENEEEQAAAEPATPVSPRRSERMVKSSSPLQDSGRNSQGESTLLVGSPSKNDSEKGPSQVVTRSRHKSGQSDADVSEVESTTSNSSTRVTRSRQSPGSITDSARKLRRHRSYVISEPILESKEDEELSAAESNCSSVSTRASRTTRASASRSTRARSRKSALLSETVSDHSETESNCSSVSGMQKIATRSTRTSGATRPLSVNSESQKEEISEAESFNSDFASKPRIRRSSRRIQSKPQSGEDKSAGQTSSQEQELPCVSASRSTRARSRKSALLSETVSDHSEAESNCSSVSEMQKIGTRSTRTSGATRPLFVNSESQKEEISEAESFNSDFASQSRTRHSSRRIQSKPQSGEDKSAGKTSSQEQESPKKQRYSLRTANVIKPLSPVQEKTILSSPSRSLRNLISIDCSNIIVLSDSNTESREFSNKHAHVDQQSLGEQANLPALLERKIPETSQSTNDVPVEIFDLTEELVDEPQLEEQDQGKADDDSKITEVTNKDVPNLHTEKQSEHCSASNFTESVQISLLLDSDESEESESSEEDSDIEMVEEVEENYEYLMKQQSKEQTSAEKSKDVVDNGLFVIDTAPGLDSTKKYYVDYDVAHKPSEREQSEEEELSEPDEEEEDFIDEEVDDDDDSDEEELLNRPKRGFDLSTSIETGLSIKKLGGLYINFDAEKPNPGPSLHNKMKKESKNKDELLKKSVITPDFEKRESVPPYRESLNKLKKQRKEEREKTTGRGWFDMKAPEMTEELKNDLKALKMRSAMDPKRFYKKDDREGLPKYFQVGTVVDNPLDYYHSRIPKKQRKRTIVEELLADSEFRRYNKKKYQEIIAERSARAEGKKNRKKKKFRT